MLLMTSNCQFLHKSSLSSCKRDRSVHYKYFTPCNRKLNKILFKNAENLYKNLRTQFSFIFSTPLLKLSSYRFRCYEVFIVNCVSKF